MTTINTFLRPYLRASQLVEYHRREHRRLINRCFLSYGVSLGLLGGIVYLAGEGYPIPAAFVILHSAFFIYGCFMVALSYRYLTNQIRMAEKMKFEAMVPLDELSILPFGSYRQSTLPGDNINVG